MTEKSDQSCPKRIADELIGRLSEQLDELSDYDQSNWSSSERARRLWILSAGWKGEVGDLLDAVAVLAGRRKVRWLPDKGVFDGLARLAYPYLDPQRRSELIRAVSSIDAAVDVSSDANSIKMRVDVLRRVGGVDQSTREKKNLSPKRVTKALKHSQRRRDEETDEKL